MRRLAILLSMAACSLLILLGVGGSPASAEEEEQSVGGSLSTPDDEPIEGAELTVYDADGEVVDTVESDADGEWELMLAEPGAYTVELDESTLPDGLVVENGNPRRELQVRGGQHPKALYKLGAKVVGDDTETDDDGESDSESEEGEAAPDEDVGEEAAFGSGFWPRVYSGIHLGLMIALAGLGLSLIFGTAGLTNFAHGELVTFGAMMALMFHVVGVFGFGLPLLAAAPAAVLVGAAFGYALDRGLWAPLRRRGVGLIAMMIISIGLSLLLRNLFQYLMGSERRRYQDFSVQQAWDLGVLSIPPKTLASDGIAVLVLAAVIGALMYTRLGKATRAVSDNPALAEASGINADQIIRMVWALGAGLASLAGVLMAVHEGSKFDMGFHLLLFVFAAVIVGGLGTAYGPVVGGLLVGVLIQVSTLWIPNEFKYVVALAVLIIVLLIRPQGILGRRERVG
ncbi:MAG: ABC transporter permease subunit [Stackebrandtia sp.]